MPYIADRLVHDADAHVMEEPDWLVKAADPEWRDRMPMVFVDRLAPGETGEHELDVLRRRHADPEYRADNAGQIMLRRTSPPPAPSSPTTGRWPSI